jgi:hypothetical protein
VPETRLICLCDCEADIYELLATAAEQAPDQPHVEYVIRSQFDRTLVDDGSLRASLQRQPVLGEVEFQVTSARRTRLVRQTVRGPPQGARGQGKLGPLGEHDSHLPHGKPAARG